MSTLLIVFALWIGVGIGYLIFYWRFADRNIVTQLRKDNSLLKHDLQESDRDRMEFEQQNIILKDEIRLLYLKNDDLTQVVSELSRYYYHMKKVSEKMDSLARDLQQPLEDMDKDIKQFLYSDDDERAKKFIHHLQGDSFDTDSSEQGFF